MAEADRLTIAAGTPGTVLMENAGRAVFHAIVARYRPQTVAVLCGPGNNGGDGWVVARLLRDAGFDVRLASLAPAERLTGDAAAMARRWTGPVQAFTPEVLDGAGLIVDAVFGAGLARAIDGAVVGMIRAVRPGQAVVAVDLPSGISGETGAELGIAFTADLTVTFFRAKPGHWLYPGRARCGRLVVADIGIDAGCLDAIGPRHALNGPDLWGGAFPLLRTDGHKYDRGHTVVLAGGPLNTGAARLAARAALRCGSGLVTTVAGPEAALVVAAHQTACMVAALEGPADFARFLEDGRRNAVVVGPAAGLDEATFAAALAAVSSGAAAVLDADALTVMKGRAGEIFAARRGPLVLTPHDGEFARVFPALADLPSRAARAAAAARDSGAVVVLKGADSCIAAPDGRVAINGNAPPTLATAGSGDVLAGIVAGLMAQRMPAFEAAAAGVWLHGLAAQGAGRGMIADDLVERLPLALQHTENHLLGMGQAG
ncbi:bifunctional ADP-dependent NAD(P)H-hydrate dehydratase/NAD(P)H-hydrate epimerase [Zavarzinia compransoris]|uniref:Bifunctional NAD(P)H-hydrate repair enzyme n=2 Tax=Zavarzinia compransoris TaxID=1264899 RepID=A0A317ECW9_9PROT|nr:bifunctional ADP-dependent NAD(P)H-hydrate dehydratase/NAD(P)H-hydrate epimerase [Zavarzinia compransoris]